MGSFVWHGLGIPCSIFQKMATYPPAQCLMNNSDWANLFLEFVVTSQELFVFVLTCSTDVLLFFSFSLPLPQTKKSCSFSKKKKKKESETFENKYSLVLILKFSIQKNHQSESTGHGSFTCIPSSWETEAR